MDESTGTVLEGYAVTGSNVGGGLFGGMMKEIRQFPYTVTTVIAVSAIMGFYLLPTTQRVDAGIAGLPALRADVISLRLEMLRVRISMLDNSMAQLEVGKSNAERLAQPVPGVITELLRRTSTERALAEQELGALLVRGQDANEP